MRILDRLVAAVVAAAVATAGVVAVIEIVNAAFGQGYVVVEWRALADALARNSWSDTGPKIFGAVTVALGVVLFAVGFRRGQSSRLPVRPLSEATAAAGGTAVTARTTRVTGSRVRDDTPTATFVRRRGLARALRRTAESVDGVTSARVRFRRRRVTAQVGLRPRTSADVPDRVAEAVGRKLASFDLVRTPPVRVRGARRDGRGRSDDGLVFDPSGLDGLDGLDGFVSPSGLGGGTAASESTGHATTQEPATTQEKTWEPPTSEPKPEPSKRAPMRHGRARRKRTRQERTRQERARRGQQPKPFAAWVDRLDRVALTLFGLVMLAGGTVVLLAGFGVLGADTENATTLTPQTRSFAADHGWFWPVVGVAAGFVALAAMTWLAAQLSTGRLRRLTVTEDAFGSAYVEGSGIADAVADDADRDDGVRHARARLLGGPGDPLVRLVLTVEPDADILWTRQHAETEVLARVRQALDRPDLRGQVELEPTDLPARRAR